MRHIDITRSWEMRVAVHTRSETHRAQHQNQRTRVGMSFLWRGIKPPRPEI